MASQSLPRHQVPQVGRRSLPCRGPYETNPPASCVDWADRKTDGQHDQGRNPLARQVVSIGQTIRPMGCQTKRTQRHLGARRQTLPDHSAPRRPGRPRSPVPTRRDQAHAQNRLPASFRGSSSPGIACDPPARRGLGSLDPPGAAGMDLLSPVSYLGGKSQRIF